MAVPAAVWVGFAHPEITPPSNFHQLRDTTVGFLSAHNPYDRNSFSGTPFYMLRALEACPDVRIRVLGKHRQPRGGVFEKVLRKFGANRSYVFERPDIDDRGLDAIIAPVASGLISRFGASLQAPIVFVTDATPSFVRDFYNKPVAPDAEKNEARVLSLAECAVYSSQFMADRALSEFHGIPLGKIHVIPFGLNLDKFPDTAPAKPPSRPLRLLFIGKEWQRKGGDLAIAALDELRAAGVDAILTVIGCTLPPEKAKHPAVEWLGYLDKNDPLDVLRLTDALSRSHVFILPTRADCTPMVVAEANAYGCPALVTDTGGIPSLIEVGTNGMMLPMEADGAAWAAAVLQITSDPETYQRLSASSLSHCRSRLSWDAWARSMVEIVREIKGLERSS